MAYHQVTWLLVLKFITLLVNKNNKSNRLILCEKFKVPCSETVLLQLPNRVQKSQQLLSYHPQPEFFKMNNIIRDRPIICMDLHIWTTFRLRWLGGFEEAGCSDFGLGNELYNWKFYNYCEVYRFSWSWMFGLRVGWVGLSKPEHYSDL